MSRPPLLQRLALIFLACIGPATALADGTPVGGLPIDSNGWTIVNPSADSRVVYVSTSGNDANNGLSEAAPKRTIAAGYALLRTGYPDWLLLKRGETWNESLGRARKCGRSGTEPMLIGAYGASTARPMLRTALAHGLDRSGGFNIPERIDNLAIIGISFLPTGYDGGNGQPFGIWWAGGGTNFLVEDCKFEGYYTGLGLQGDPASHLNNCAIRRCVIVDSFGNGHAQGLYVTYVDNLLLEENVIDHNGWKTGVSEPDIFKHNIYISTANTGVTVRGNLITQGSSHGLQLRSGGAIERNVFIRNPLALQLGGGDPDPLTHTYGVTGSITDNVILDGTDITPSLPRGSAIEVSNIGASGALVQGNIIAHNTSSGAGTAICIKAGGYGTGVGALNVTVRSNKVYDWRGPLVFTAPGGGQYQQGHRVEQNDFQDPWASIYSSVLVNSFGPTSGMASFSGNRYMSGLPFHRTYLVNNLERSYNQWVPMTAETQSAWTSVGYPAPSRSAASYNAAQGRPASFDDFIAQARVQSRYTWRTAYETASIAQYFRDGFGAGGGSPCSGDLDNNGRIDTLDAILFQSLFVARSPLADVNHDNQWTVLDFTTFQSLLVTGCP